MLLALCCLVGLMLPMSRIYDWEMNLFRKWGWNKLATTWENRKSWWLPMAKTIMANLGIISVLGVCIAVFGTHILYVLSGQIFHGHFDQHSEWQGVPSIKVGFFLFTLFTAVAFPYVAIARWKSDRNTRLGCWAFSITTTALCICLLGPLTFAFGRLITYIHAMGFTPRRIYGLLYGLGGYIAVLGFLYWATRTHEEERKA